MRLDTKVWFKFESIGSPEHTVEGEFSILDSAREYINFMRATRLNERIIITVAREQVKLAPTRTMRKQAEQAALDAMFDELDNLQNESPEEQ